jgi:hypothetical protein
LLTVWIGLDSRSQQIPAVVTPLKSTAEPRDCFELLKLHPECPWWFQFSTFTEGRYIARRRFLKNYLNKATQMYLTTAYDNFQSFNFTYERLATLKREIGLKISPNRDKEGLSSCP